MSQRNSPFVGGTNNWLSIIIGLLVLIFIFVGLMSLAKLTYRLLTFVAIPLLVITAILDYKVILNYINWIIKLIRNNTILGIIAGLLSVIGYPIVAAMLFGNAFLQWRLKRNKPASEATFKQETPKIGEYIEYEDIKPSEKIQQKNAENKNDYEQFFK
jgi:branched-subunit amino acid transport protein